MYESPIKQLTTEMQFECENECMRVVQGVGFDVDKEELTKALAYHRGQYEKGYEDGYNQALYFMSETLIEVMESASAMTSSIKKATEAMRERMKER